MRRRVRVGLALDGVVFNFTHGWTHAYCEQFGGDLIRPEDVTDWDCSRLTHFANGREWFEWIERDHPQLFRHLPLYPGATRMVRQVADVADVVTISTKPSWAIPCTYAAIAAAELPVREVHLTRDKHLVPPCHIYLDDGPHNLERLRDEHPSALVCRWVQPWNRPLPGVLDFDDFNDFVAEVDTLA